MKKIILLFVFFMAVQGFAQTNGISYQAIIMNPKGEQLPGVNNVNSPVVNKDICMVFKFVDEFSNTEYQETVQTKTDGFGMVNLVIGKGTQTAGYAASFQAIVWSSSKKSLIVGINTNGNCASYSEISNQEFSYAPLAFSAINAKNVTGIVAIENGGTNAVTVLGAKTNLQLENVDNTTDLNKPISTATQTALNLKENLANKSTNVTTDGTSDTKYPSVKSVKTYVDANAASSSTALANEVTRATAAENTIAANLTTEATARTSADVDLTTNLSNEVTRATAAENTIAASLTTETAARTSADGTLTTNLATEVTNRTAADLLKEDVVNKSTNVNTDGTSDSKYPSVKSVKTYVDANAASASTALANEVSRATAAENTIAANLATETSARTSDDATLQTNINAVQTDVDANEAASNIALNLKAPLASPTFTGTVSGITKTMVGLGNIDDTSDLNKPVSTATQTALNLKVDKVSGERLINATEITKLSNQSGTNTGDQDISGIAANTNKIGDLTSLTTTAKSNLVAVVNEIGAGITTNTTKIGDLTSLTTTAKSNLVAAVNEIESEKAPLASPTFTGTVSGITKSMVGLGDVDNTTDLLKPVSTATQTALDSKVDKVTGKGLSTEDYTSTEKTKLAAITGTNTGDQDISGIAANTTKIGDLTSLTTTAKSNLVAAVNEIGAGIATNTTNIGSLSSLTTTAKSNLVAAVNEIEEGTATITTKIGDLTSLTTTANSNLVAAVNEIESGKAPLASPTFTGTPLAPTADSGTSTTQIATTKFVSDAISTLSVPYTGATGPVDLGAYDLKINGTSFGTNGQPGNIGIGINAGSNTQGSNTVAIGNETGMNTQGSNAVAIGAYTAGITQGSNAVAVGYQVAYTNQGSSAVAIGNETASTNQGDNAIAIGNSTGSNNQGPYALAVGASAGSADQGTYAVAMGTNSGNANQGTYAIAVGNETGYENQGSNAVAVGTMAGKTNQGENSIAIGSNAGKNNQNSNSIILNATGNDLDTATSGFFVAPIRNVSSSTALFYDITTKEITYGSLPSVSLTSGVTGILPVSNGGSGVNTATGTGSLVLSASPTFTGTVSGITKAMVGLNNVDNTTDLLKPVSTATQTALDLKVDKVSGKGLSTEDYTTVEKTKLAAITGTNTGDQDISGIAANTTSIGSLSGLTTTAKSNLVAAVNEVGTGMSSNSSKIGDLSGLTTTAQSNLVAAVNEIGTGITTNTTSIGSLSSLTTTAKSNLVAAVNEIESAKANLASPTFTGIPLAPTADAGTNTTQIATTAFVTDAITTSSTPDASTTEKGKIQLAGDLSGTAALPTITNDAVTSTKIADGTILNADISSSAGITYSKLNLVGSVASTDIIDGAITSAKITTSPSFTGTPLAPTATVGTNTTQIATTAFVTNAVSNAIIEVADEFSATASQTSFTLTQTPSTNSKVKMYINGIRISKTAYSVSGTILTYNAANNGSYALSVGDRIQFDYFY